MKNNSLLQELLISMGNALFHPYKDNSPQVLRHSLSEMTLLRTEVHRSRSKFFKFQREVQLGLFFIIYFREEKVMTEP